MRTLGRVAITATALVAPFAVLYASAVPAAAACRGMTISYSVSSGQFVVLSPSHVDVAFGGCVSFTNHTATTANVTVGGHYSQQLAPNSSTTGSRDFVGTTSGRLSVTATSGAAPGNTAHGSITVGNRPRPSASTSASPRPSRGRTPTPATAPEPTASGGTGPRVAPTPKHHPRTPSATPRAGGVIEPPVSPPGPIQLSPAPTATAGPGAVVAGPLEPASGRSVGLPAALAAVAVVGTGTALIRVVAAEPVDSD